MLKTEKKANEKLITEIRKVKEVFDTYNQLTHLIQAENSAPQGK
jgi:hypothetical protein